MRRIAIILAVLLFATSIVACGQKGTLKLPSDTPAPVPKGDPRGAGK